MVSAFHPFTDFSKPDDLDGDGRGDRHGDGFDRGRDFARWVRTGTGSWRAPAGRS